MNTSKEIDYSNRIDCKLNYYNYKEMLESFEEAKLISQKSVFRFLEELVYVPIQKINSKKVIKNVHTILSYVDNNFNHQLKKIAFLSIEAKLNKKLLSTKKSMIFMNEVQKCSINNYSLLNTILSATRRNINISMVENFYEYILEKWNVNSPS